MTQVHSCITKEILYPSSMANTGYYMDAPNLLSHNTLIECKACAQNIYSCLESKPSYVQCM